MQLHAMSLTAIVSKIIFFLPFLHEIRGEVIDFKIEVELRTELRSINVLTFTFKFHFHSFSVDLSQLAKYIGLFTNKSVYIMMMWLRS